VVTKSELSSGKSSLTSMVSTPQEPITETLTYNSKESMFISTRPQEEDMFPEPSSWILSQEQWTQLELDLLDNSSDLTTSSLDKLEPETTGLRDTTLKELNSLTQFSTSLEKKLKDATASKDSKSLTLSEEELDQEWELSSSPRSEKNTLIESWKLSQSSPLPKCLTLSLNPTTPLYQSIN